MKTQPTFPQTPLSASTSSDIPNSFHRPIPPCLASRPLLAGCTGKNSVALSVMRGTADNKLRALADEAEAPILL